MRMSTQTKSIKNVLQLCERYFFARPVLTTGSAVDRFTFGPPGEILKNNIHNEWIYSSVTNTEHNIYPYYSSKTMLGPISNDLKEPFLYVKQLNNAQLPFGIADSWLGTKDEERLTSDVNTGETYFQPRQQTFLRTCIFARPSTSVQTFDNWQKQRKIWWRKFSAAPGRFSLTEFQNVEGVQSVNIQAAFPWGQETVETITFRGSSAFCDLDENDKALFTTKEGNRKVVPHVVDSITSLERAVITFICDAYEEDEFQGHPREVMHLHRKLAPYKIAFSASSTTASISEELNQLALYLSKQLRKAGITTLLLADMSKKSLENQFTRNDEMGIPYTLVLNESTLKNGIAGLRSRDTTLKEQVHVTDLKNYMESLLKNY